MHHLISLLSQCRDFRRLVETLESGNLRQTGSSPTFPCFSIHGVSRSARACYVASLWPYLRRPCLILTADTESTSHVATELESLIPSLLATDGTTDVVPRVLVLPSHDLLFEATSLPDPQVVQDRLAVLDAWHHDEPVFVVAPINAFAGFLVPRDLFRHGTFTLRVGVEQNLEELMRRLVDDGYHRVDTVEQVSEFSVRGGIVDVFPPTLDKPLRLEFFGDEIVSLRQFDPQTQRSFESLDQCEISPPREMILTPPTVQAAIPRIRGALQEQQKTLSEQGREEARALLAETVELDLQRLEQLAYFPGVERYLPFLYSEGTRLVDYVPSQTLIFCDDLARLRRSWSQLADAFNEYLGDKVKAGAFLPSPLPWYPDLGTLLQRLRGHVSCNLITAAPDPGLPHRSPNTTFFTEFQMLPSFQGQVALLAERLKRWQDERKHIVCSTHHPQRLLELFRDTGVSAVRLAKPTGSGTEHQVKQRRQRQKALPPGEIEVATYGVAAGFELPEAKLIFLTDAEIFGWSGVHRRWRKRREGSVAIASPVDLDLGDYVVHISHGIGLYQGISRQTVRGSEGEYLLIQYAGADRLFVPVHQIDRIHKFIGSNGVAPALSSLSGASWETTKKRALKAAKDIAEDLAKLYSAREQAEGHSFPPDSPWQREMEVSFEWEETPDQAKAIEVVKEDMESESPMDRLICGDVGYGKTEVALRAAFKSVQDNKQVAVLVPTTVLAQQHFNTFRERLAPYPVTIDLLSRFRSRIEQEGIVKSIRAGSVDIVIGTHRLLSKDMKFKDLGLLIIDEEHRFGVEQKEILKQLKTEVDVLTLTATPIPRTLHMALGGIRNMSIINDPPRGRLPVQTYVTQFEDDLVRTAILREMERGGQVFFVHNRVRSIRHVASHIARLLPTARIAIGHGQLPEDELEEIMLDFYNGQYDILLCTTIIESGLDIPNANTLIVDRCEHFGLAQLYQLRGRVGRSDRQAYAYFLYGRHAKLGYAMEQRIEALKEFSGLGSGFKVALRDLEIRGAGNLLGAEQHGNIQSVGFDLYCEMLSQAVSEIHNKPMETHRDFPEVDLPVSAYLSEDYIPNLNQRLDIYRRLASVEVLKDVDSLETELEDRFGVMPAPVSNLLRIMRLRLGCQSISVERISQSEREMLLRFTPRARPSQGECLKLYRELSASHSHDLLNAVKIKPEGMSLNPRGLDPQTTLGFIEDIVHTMATWRVA